MNPPKGVNLRETSVFVYYFEFSTDSFEIKRSDFTLDEVFRKM